ncbi:MAG: iron chelate uptake ABC transporter family permease subunit [Pseudomonadota bacterium]
MQALIDALLLRTGYNASLVGIGSALLGFSAGAAGTFLYLRKRALVSDAIAHATLPGVVLAFLIMVSFGADGRSLMGLLIGSAVSAALGLFVMEWMTRNTRLSEDAAIGAVLSVFFGFGVVLLTVVQSVGQGRQAGLQDLLLGSSAGMLFSDAITIAIGGAVTVAIVWVLKRPMSLVSFDAEFSSGIGINARQIDLAIMGLVLAVTVIGLKLVGLVLIVALLIIAPVAARFWTENAARIIWISGLIGAVSGYVGAAISASVPSVPTGPVIVLTATTLFVISLFCAPSRGLAAQFLARRDFRRRVHRRQGLLSLSRGEPIHDGLTLRVLIKDGLIRPDGVATEDGRALAAKIARDERRWDVARHVHQDTALAGRYDGLTAIEDLFTPDEIQEFDRIIGGPTPVGGQ